MASTRAHVGRDSPPLPSDTASIPDVVAAAGTSRRVRDRNGLSGIEQVGPTHVRL
jgi:hypothetical protein